MICEMDPYLCLIQSPTLSVFLYHLSLLQITKNKSITASQYEETISNVDIIV